MSLTTCYSNLSGSPSEPIEMTTLSLGPPTYSSSIYTASIETFIDDINAKVTINLIQSTMVKFNWCS